MFDAKQMEQSDKMATRFDELTHTIDKLSEENERLREKNMQLLLMCMNIESKYLEIKRSYWNGEIPFAQAEKRNE